jgi:ferrous iron transport protein B
LHCCDEREEIHRSGEIPKILLIGNPNVGKSVIFSKLTGHEVMASNYAGTTVTYSSGKAKLHGKQAVITDAPGMYSLAATSSAEEVALNLLNTGADTVICVLDATNLERNLNFALQLKELGLPLVFALNLVDVAEQKGINIDVTALQKELGFPVIPTVAVRNIGLAELVTKAFAVAMQTGNTGRKHVLSSDERWQEVGRIIGIVQKVEHRHPTFWERLGDNMIMPFPGLLIAALVLAASLGVVVGGGKGLRAGLLLPLVNDFYVPFVSNFVSALVPEGMIRNILIGDYGVLIKSIEWPFALILPYVFLFYIVLSFLEDTGYLPRLGVLADGIMRRLGIQGGDLIPMMIGYGCAVPAILGTRAATTSKQRLIVSALVVLAVPCASQTGAFVALLGDQSVSVLLLVYFISLCVIFFSGMLLKRVVPGQSDTILIEVPNLLIPNAHALFKKMWIRLKHFMIEAGIPMLLGVAIAALVAETGVLVNFSKLMEPIVVNWLGLPGEASLSLILGILRRELAVMPLLEMDLSTVQLLVGSLVALFYIPCLTVLGVLIKEFGVRVAAAISVSTIIFALFFAGLINQAISLFLSIV